MEEDVGVEMEIEDGGWECTGEERGDKVRGD